MGEALQIILIVAAVVITVSVVAFLVYMAKKGENKASDGQRVEKVDIIDGVRYTRHDQVLTDDGKIKISHAEGDFNMQKGKEYTVKTGGTIMPGKYTVLSTDESVLEFNMRISGFVRTCKHNSSIVLSEGDKVCAVSHAVILR